MNSQLAWECKCGEIEYGEYPPEECSKCWKAGSYSMMQTDDDADDMLGDLE